MNGKTLKTVPSLAHPSDRELLLHLDRELSWPRALAVRRHVSDCSECRGRMVQIGAAFDSAAQGYVAPETDASGPRALLRARLAGAAEEFKQREPRQLGFVRGLAYVCALALLVSIGVSIAKRQFTANRVASSQPLQDRGITPGLTRSVSLSELCSVERDEVVRNVPDQLQQKVFREYGISGATTKDFEVDYLITPGLGGADDMRNLWPEPHANTTWNSYVKDQLEDHLHRMVCDRKLGLDEAQRDIASNWIEAYKKYFHTDQPLMQHGSPSESAAVRAE